MKEENTPIDNVFETLSGDSWYEQFFSLLDLYDDNTPMTWNGINRDVLMMFLKKKVSEIAHKTHDI